MHNSKQQSTHLLQNSMMHMECIVNKGESTQQSHCSVYNTTTVVFILVQLQISSSVSVCVECANVHRVSDTHS